VGWVGQRENEKEPNIIIEKPHVKRPFRGDKEVDSGIILNRF
jgi:hypothetical protein